MAAVASSAVAGCPQKLPCPDRSPLGMGGVWGVGEKALALETEFQIPTCAAASFAALGKSEPCRAWLCS